MKKFLGILVLGLMLSGNAYAVKLSCTDNTLSDFDGDIEFSRVEIILDSNGSVHITEYKAYVPPGDVYTKEYYEKIKTFSTNEKKREWGRAYFYNSNPLKKNPKDGVKSEKFTSIAFKAGGKIRTQLIIKDSTATELVFVDFYEIDLDTKVIKKFMTVTPESKAWWNSNWDEEKAKKVGAQKIGAPILLKSYINCTTESDSSSSSDVASSGSGFFINNKGYFVTNNHVVKGCKQSKITFKEESVDAEVVATDQTLDLALLKAKVKPRNYLNLSDDPPEKLQKIYVAGYPFGKGLSDDLKLTQGIISSVKGYGDNSNQIQIDAAINSGNSGGPIVDEDGDLVGVAVSGLNKSKAEGIAFGIKSAAVKNFLDVNKIKYSTSSLMNFGMSNKKLNNLLEDSAVYTFCN
mgnify:CR=1 FL=1